jgi:hypothetical protein
VPLVNPFAHASHVVRDPGALLLLRCVVKRLCTIHCLYVEVCDVVFAIGQLHADLELGVEHHVVLPQPPWAVVDTHDTLLHLHLLCGAAPCKRIILALLAARRCDCDTTLGEGETRSWAAHRFCDFRGSTTPDVLRCADTSGMC